MMKISSSTVLNLPPIWWPCMLLHPRSQSIFITSIKGIHSFPKRWIEGGFVHYIVNLHPLWWPCMLPIAFNLSSLLLSTDSPLSYSSTIFGLIFSRWVEWDGTGTWTMHARFWYIAIVYLCMHMYMHIAYTYICILHILRLYVINHYHSSEYIWKYTLIL